MQEYTVTKKQGIYNTLRFYSCPKCQCVIYKGDEKCQNCGAKLKWEESHDNNIQ